MLVKRIFIGTAVFVSLAGSIVIVEASTGQSTNNSTGSGAYQRFHGGRNFGASTVTVFAKVIGISPTTLMSDERAGKTILQVAQSKHLTQSKLVSESEALYKKQLDAQVKSKKLKAAAESQMIKSFAARINQMITRKGFGGFSHHRNGGGQGNPTNPTST